MFKTALVGVDHSLAEASLLTCLPDLTNWGIESVILAHVIQVGYAQGAGFGHESEYEIWLEETAASLREVGLTVTTSVTASGDVAEELLTVARAKGADLVVVGSRSHSFVRQVFLGSVAKETIRVSEIPVLIERLEPTETGHGETCASVCSGALERILVATDLSDQSRSAEDAAVCLASRAGNIDFLTVLAADAGTEQRREAKRHHQVLLQRIEEVGGSAGSRIELGIPLAEISRVGQEDYSLIIVGKHGRTWIAGALVGNTAAAVCETARRPVLMVPLQ